MRKSLEVKPLLSVVLLILCCIFTFTFACGAAASEQNADTPSVARPSSDGQLKVSGSALVNQDNEPAVLHGVSTHGLSYYPEFVNGSLFRFVSDNWNVDLVRLPMYSEEYVKAPEYNLNILRTGIEAAIAADQYVIVDWHILEDNDPHIHMEEAKVFFSMISEEYAGVPNILYEICNEPNGDVTWDDIYDYAEQIVPLIRKASPDAPIFIGTPDYDRDLTGPVSKPFPDPNVMYSFHFYAASHHDEMMQILGTALSAGLPVFVTECGISEESGNGRIDYEYAGKWFTYLSENDLSFTIWSLSNKNESSAMIKASSGAYLTLSEEDLTDSGKWVRSLMLGEDPLKISRGAEYPSYSFWEYIKIQIYSLGREGLASVRNWPWIALGCAVFLALCIILKKKMQAKQRLNLNSYDDVVAYRESEDNPASRKRTWFSKRTLIYALWLLTLIYLVWRIGYSVNTKSGWLAIACNLLLLLVEFVGFLESTVHYNNMMSLTKRPLPEISDDEFPDVDIFIATYNEPEELLRRTINGCKHLKYPDPSKVHIWVCDDNRRSSMKELAESMNVGYFDRPDNQGAKAGNLNHAMSLTSAPYIVTLDADMIVRSEFLLKTIPYFIHVEKCCADLPEEKKRHLGLLQSPQSFYDPDLFQFALYSEKNVTNEQDFFYRAVEVGKTSTNSVIYGGSNTVLSRKALEAVGGFYTETITEDFATGMLIEAAGYLSLAIPEPLASGKTPSTFREHIKQRTRWGRGVINSAKSLHLLSRKGLTLSQKFNYLSSVVYWYSPIKNFVYLLAPLMFAVFLIPVFRCNWLELLLFWIPMFIVQDFALRIVGDNKTSLKWSSIYETCTMPFLLIPVVKETFGISLKAFQVTDKSGNAAARKSDLRYVLPFVVLIVLSVVGIVRVLFIANLSNLFGMIIILFWIIRNLYSLVMVLFLINGRDMDDDMDYVTVRAKEMAMLRSEKGENYDGITTEMTEHSLKIFLDEAGIKTGDLVDAMVDTADYHVELKAIVTHVRRLRFSGHCVASLEILEHRTTEEEYFQVLYDRIPTLPQSLHHDFGVMRLLWRNIVYRMMRTVS